MKINWRMAGGVLAVLPLLLTGCGERAPEDPPLKESELLIRFFKNTQEKHYEEAVRQLDKLQLLNPENGDLGEMRIRLVANACVVKVQPLLNAGKLDEALAAVQAARNDAPLNNLLRLIEKEITDLIALRQAMQELRNAKEINALAAALEKLHPLVVAGSQAETLLKPEITRREKELAELKRAEERKAEAAEKAVPPPPAPAPGKTEPAS